MEPKCSLPFSHKPTTRPYTEPDNSNPRRHTIFKIYYNVTFSSASRSSKWSSKIFRPYFCVYFSSDPCMLHAPPSSSSLIIHTGKVKGEIVSVLFYNWTLRHEGVLGSGSIVPRVLDLSTRWKWMVNFTPRPLYPQGKSPWYPLGRRLGGLQSQSERGGERKNSQPLPVLEPPIIQTVAQRYTTEISWLPNTSKNWSGEFWLTHTEINVTNLTEELREGLVYIPSDRKRWNNKKI
jgi:hypothetical protein